MNPRAGFAVKHRPVPALGSQSPACEGAVRASAPGRSPANIPPQMQADAPCSSLRPLESRSVGVLARGRRPRAVLHRGGLALLLLAASFFAVGQAQAPVDGDLIRALQDGVWCNSDDTGDTCWGYDEFLPGGLVRACGKDGEDSLPYRAEGRYEVRGRYVCFELTQATPNFGLKPGHKFCTEVLGIDAQTQRYRDLETDEVVVLFRRPKSAWKCASDT